MPIKANKPVASRWKGTQMELLLVFACVAVVAGVYARIARCRRSGWEREIRADAGHYLADVLGEIRPPRPVSDTVIAKSH